MRWFLFNFAVSITFFPMRDSKMGIKRGKRKLSQCVGITVTLCHCGWIWPTAGWNACSDAWRPNCEEQEILSRKNGLLELYTVLTNLQPHCTLYRLCRKKKPVQAPKSEHGTLPLAWYGRERVKLLTRARPVANATFLAACVDVMTARSRLRATWLQASGVLGAKVHPAWYGTSGLVLTSSTASYTVRGDSDKLGNDLKFAVCRFSDEKSNWIAA